MVIYYFYFSHFFQTWLKKLKKSLLFKSYRWQSQWNKIRLKQCQYWTKNHFDTNIITCQINNLIKYLVEIQFFFNPNLHVSTMCTSFLQLNCRQLSCYIAKMCYKCEGRSPAFIERGRAIELEPVAGARFLVAFLNRQSLCRPLWNLNLCNHYHDRPPLWVP